MTAQPLEPAPAEPTEPTGVLDPATEPAAAAPDPDEPGAQKDDDTPAVIKALREDFKQERAKRQDAERKAEEAVKQLTERIGKALGLVTDEPVDPAALTDQVTKSQEAARSAQMELAVFRNAGDDADAAALLDSRTFLAKVADIDPSDSEAIQAAINEAVEANPRLGKAPAAPTGMKPNPAQGRSSSPPLGVGEQIAAAQKAGDIKAVLRLKSSQALQNGPSS